MICSGINEQNPGRAGYTTMVRRYAGRWKDRFWEIDFLRGLCVVLMVFDHFMYCLWDVMPVINGVLGTSLFDGLRPFALEYWNWDLRNNVREVVILLFFLLCGVSCTLTRGNFRRFIPLALVAAGLSAVTSVLSELTGSNMTIFFGVIHMIAAGVLLYAVIDNAAQAVGGALPQRCGRARFALRLLPGLVGVGLLAAYFALWGDWYAASPWHFVSTYTPPEGLSDGQKIFQSVFIELRGFRIERFYGGDYFPVLPYAAFILIGGLVGMFAYHTRARWAFSRLNGAWNSGLCFFGRHAAVIYIAHMVVIPAVLAILAAASLLFS